MAKNNICIAVKEKLVKDSGVAEEIAYDNIVQKLLTKPRARGKLLLYILNTTTYYAGRSYRHVTSIKKNESINEVQSCGTSRIS